MLSRGAIDIVVDASGVLVGDHYFIEKCRIDTAEKLLKWVLHLSEKTWADRKFINRLIFNVAQAYNIEVHGL